MPLRNWRIRFSCVVAAVTKAIHRYQTQLCAFLVILAIAAAVLAAVDLFTVLAFEARGPINEYAIYTIVGRGILNGLTPYVDLFETKPPGMFLLAALSLLFTGGDLLAIVLEIAFLLFFPVSLALFYLHRSPNWKSLASAFVALALFCLGVLLALYLEEHGGTLQTELFGSLFSYLYLLTLSSERWESRWLLCVRGVLLMIAVGLKEPFLPATVAAAIILIRSPGEFWRKYLLPLGIAIVGSFIVLLALGWLWPFFSVYLPAMVVNHAAEMRQETVFMRGFHIRRIFMDIVTYGTSPLLGYGLCVLFIVSPFVKAVRRDMGTLVLTMAAMFASCIFFMKSYYAVGYLLYWNVFNFSFDEQLVKFLWLYAFWGALAATLLFFLLKRDKFVFCCALAHFAALYFFSFAIGMGQYSVYHFSLGFPFYAALILLFTAYLRWPHSRLLAGVVLSLAVLGAALYAIPLKHLQHLESSTQNSYRSNSFLVRKVDLLLTSCSFERYYGFSSLFDLAYTRHSPLGPLVEIYNYSIFGEDHPIVQQTMDNVLGVSPVIFVKKDRQLSQIDESMLAGLTGKMSVRPLFTETPPSCAREHLPIDGYTVLFRL